MKTNMRENKETNKQVDEYKNDQNTFFFNLYKVHKYIQTSSKLACLYCIKQLI